MRSKYICDSLEELPQSISYCVVLGESLGVNDAIIGVLKPRLKMAKQLFEKNPSVKFIVTGNGKNLVGNVPDVLYRYMVYSMEIPKEQIIVDKEGYSTLESMQNVKKIIGKETFVFFTDVVHMSRCVYICRRLGLQGYGVRISDLVFRQMKLYRIQEFVAKMEDCCRLTVGMTSFYKVIKKVRFLFALYKGKRTFNRLKKVEEDPMTQSGRIAIDICPDILKYLTKHIKIILVTGTNGKTSSSRMLEQILKKQGITCFSNRSGANTVMGVVAEFLIHSNFRGRYKEEYGIIECDEGNFPKVAPFLASENITVLVTNLFQDQLDRFGQLEYTRKCILSSLLSIPKAKVVLNADCAMTASLSEEIPNECVFYGVNGKEEKHTALVSNTMLCPICGNPLLYRSRLYGHFGDYSCKVCQWERPKKNALLEYKESACSVILDEKTYMNIDIEETVPYYCLYNNMGVATVLWQHGFKSLIENCFSMNYYNPGRFEKITIDGCDFYVILVKNTVGFQQSINRLPKNLSGADLVFGLNDNYNDGTDVSWMWECDFSPILNQLAEDTRLYSFGKRCANMALKLKYDGFDGNSVIRKETFKELYEIIKQSGRSVYIFANYTAMFSSRVFLQRRANLKKFWEEE